MFERARLTIRAKVEWKGSMHYAYGGTHYKPYYRGSSLVHTVTGS